MNAESKRDWSLVIAGAALVILGVVFLMSPLMTLVTIAMVAGIGLVAVGIVDTISYFRFRKEWDLSGWNLAYAVFDILLGAALLLHPLISAAVLPWVVGVFLAIYGILEIVAAVEIRSSGSEVQVDVMEELENGLVSSVSYSRGWGWVLFGGIAAILCAMLFFFLPASFAIALSAFLVVRGATLAAYGVSAGYAAHAAKA